MDFFFWGGPVTSKQPKSVKWQRETATLTIDRNGSDNSTLYYDMKARDGYAWKRLCEKGGVDPSKVGSIGIGGFSAFHYFANAWCENDTDYARVCYVHLADACFSGCGDRTPKKGYLRLGLDAAMGRNDKLMVCTTNGPLGQDIKYSHDYGPPKGLVNYCLTSGGTCIQNVWNEVRRQTGKTEQEVVAPADAPPPTHALRIGNFIWFHYEYQNKVKDPHAYHVTNVAVPLMNAYGAPWMAGHRGGLSSLGPWPTIGMAEAVVVAAFAAAGFWVGSSMEED